MKTKLTLLVSSRSVQRAEAVARHREVPLSLLLAEHFDRPDPAAGKHDSEAFFARWQGEFKLVPTSRKDGRVAARA